MQEEEGGSLQEKQFSIIIVNVLETNGSTDKQTSDMDWEDERGVLNGPRRNNE